MIDKTKSKHKLLPKPRLLFKQQLEFTSPHSLDVCILRLQQTGTLKLSGYPMRVEIDPANIETGYVQFTLRTFETRFQGWIIGDFQQHNNAVNVRVTIGIDSFYILSTLIGFPIIGILIGFFSFPPRPIEILSLLLVFMAIAIPFRMYSESIKLDMEEGIKQTLGSSSPR